MSQATPAQERDHAGRHFFLPQRYRSPFHTTNVPTETVVTHDSYDLHTLTTTDALANQVAARIDYRVLAPKLLTD